MAVGDQTAAQDGEAITLTDAEYEAVYGDEGEDVTQEYQADQSGQAEEQAAGEAEGNTEGEAQGEHTPTDEGSAQEQGGEESAAAEAGEGAEPDAGEDGEEAPDEPEWAKTPFTPQYQADARDTATIDQDVANLNQQFEEGEVEVQEYQQKLAALERERTKSEMAQELNQQNVEQAWQHVQDAFFASNPDYATDPVLHGALDATLRSLYADEQYQGLSMGQYLATAKQMVDQRFGRAGDTDSTQANGEQNQAETNAQGDDNSQNNNQNSGEVTNQEVAQARGGRPEAPSSLAGVPEAEGESTDPWSHLNSLTGLDYEEALAKLSPLEAERYLAEG